MPILPNSFTYSSPVTVLAVISTTGTTVGGRSVLIIGSEFRYGATVTFWGNNATSVVVVDGNHITAVTPAHAAGAVNVVVTNLSGQFTVGTLVSGYTYTVAAPTVISIRQNFGAAAGAEGHGLVRPAWHRRHRRDLSRPLERA